MAQLGADQGQPGAELPRHAEARPAGQAAGMSAERRLTERQSQPTEVLVVLPTFNEKDNLERVVAGVRHLGHDVLIVDDASPDGTGDLADRIAASDSGVHDRTSGFRCYTRELLLAIKLDDIQSQGYSFQIEMVHRTVKLGYPVVEVPIRFEDRIAGASKVSQGEIRRALWKVLRLRLSR